MPSAFHQSKVIAPSAVFYPPAQVWLLRMQVGILQFSNDVRVELEPQVVDREVFDKKLATMVRLQGWVCYTHAEPGALSSWPAFETARRVQCW